MTSLPRISFFVGLLVVLLSTAAQAVPLSVDFGSLPGTGGGPGGTQPDFVAFEDAEGGGNPDELRTYASDFGVGGTVDVTIGGYTHFRDYAAITSGPFVGQSALLSDSVLRNANGTMSLTLENLLPGPYEITTFHHGTQFGAGTFDVLLSDALASGQLIADDFVSSAGTTPASIGTLMFAFVSDGSPVVIDIIGGAGGNHAQLNGFILDATAVPEPSAIAIWSLMAVLGLGCVWLCRVRTTKREAA